MPENALRDIETALTKALSFGISVQRLQVITGGRTFDDRPGLIRIPLPEHHGPEASETLRGVRAGRGCTK
jgi:hypothetical protein